MFALRSLKLFGLGTAVVVLALAVGFWTDSVWAQDQIAIYRVQPVQVTHDSVLKLAREAFGMTSPQVSEDDVVFVLRQEQKLLQIRKTGGAFALLFSDDAKLWNPSYQPSLPSTEEALRLAEEFLRKHNLLPGLIPMGPPDSTVTPQYVLKRALSGEEEKSLCVVSSL